MIINNKKVIGNKFFWDGCHKIYIVENEKDLKEMFKNGYSKKDLYNISKIKEIYNNSCSLRFISNVSLNKKYVKQFERAIFKELNEGLK